MLDKKLRVALIHDYLVQYGGAEKTLEEILDIFPQATIYTGLYEPKGMTEKINKHKVIGPKNSLFTKMNKYLTFLMPIVFEKFDLRDYDLIISDGTAWAKGVLTNPDQLHISYIHTPPRFLYGYSVESQKRNKWYFKPIVSVIDFMLRIWDVNAAQRPDYLLTNSNETKSRIQKFYRREATVIYPPVETTYKINTDTKIEYENYYVAVGRLAAYKNFDLLVKAFNETGKNLVIIGEGSEGEALRKQAKENVIFEGRVSDERKHILLENALGAINPVQDEDLGIVPIEAMAHGIPVLAHKSGGHLETIKDDVSGMFFESLEVEGFIESFNIFDKKIADNKYNKDVIKESVKKFDKYRFKKELEKYIEDKLKSHKLGVSAH